MKNCNSPVNRRTHIACLIAALFLSAVTVASDRSDAIERIGQMTQQERQEIQNKRKRFEQLSVDEQKKVRALHEQIELHDSRQKLVTAMNRYNEWLKTLSASQRAELLEMPKEKRLEQIRILKGKSDRERLSRMISANLTKDDMSHVASWIQEFAKGHRPELLEAMPDKMRRGLRDKFDARIQFFLLHNAFRKNGKLPNPSDAEIESLVNGLSSEARKQFDRQESIEDKKQLLHEWIHGFMFARNRRPEFDPKELKKFFNEELSESQRDALNKHTGDRFHRELSEVYWMWKRTGRVSVNRRWTGRGDRGDRRERFGPGGPPDRDDGRRRGRRGGRRPDHERDGPPGPRHDDDKFGPRPKPRHDREADESKDKKQSRPKEDND